MENTTETASGKLSVEEKSVAYEKLEDDYKALRTKLRENRKTLKPEEKEKLAKEIERADQKAETFKETHLNSAVFRSNKSFTIAGSGEVIGGPYTGFGLGLISDVIFGGNLLELKYSASTGSIKKGPTYTFKGDHLSLFYRHFVGNSFNIGAGITQARHRVEVSTAGLDLLNLNLSNYEQSTTHLLAAISIGSKWQKKYFVVGWDFLNVSVPVSQTIKGGKSVKFTDDERTAQDEKTKKLMNTAWLNTAVTIGFSF